MTSRAAAAALGLCLIAPAAQAQETLLDTPPRELTFQVAPASTGMDLLPALREGGGELGPYKLYTTGPWGRWRTEARWKLRWSRATGPELEAAPDEAAPAPGLALTLPESTASLAPDRAERQADAQLLVLSSELSRASSGVGGWGPSAFQLESTGASLRSDGYGALFALPQGKPVPDWRCRRRPVLVLRQGNESDRFELVRCDGTLAPESIDRLTLLARPADVPRPFDLLPDEPSAEAWSARREWAPGVRVVHPRLAFVLQQIADAFPYKPILIYSGYRPLAEVNDGSGHKSLHAAGRALDIAVLHVANEDLFKVCTTIRGAGCGFYPHNRFVHVDVRRAGPGEAFWIDGSQPGEPARYLDDYPGLVEDGRLAFPRSGAGKR